MILVGWNGRLINTLLVTSIAFWFALPLYNVRLWMIKISQQQFLLFLFLFVILLWWGLGKMGIIVVGQ